MTGATTVGTVVEVLEAVRARVPLVHCLTNVVVTNVTADGQQAVGASPAMVENAEESADFARIADGLLVNLGTLSRERAEAMRLAAAAAREAGTPWVLDPVAVGALAFRTGLAAELLEHRPDVVRGNASEVLALAGASGAGRGVDSTASAESAVEAARELARRTGGAVAVSGEVDQVTDGETLVQVRNGSPMLTRVTGAGCLLGALVAACAGTGARPLDAAVAATGILTVAADVAAETTSAPGSFAVALVDALFTLEGPVLAERLVLA